jgi:hypothetical protein
MGAVHCPLPAVAFEYGHLNMGSVHLYVLSFAGSYSFSFDECVYCFRLFDVMFWWSPQLSTISINGDIMMMVNMSDLLIS